MAVQFQPSPGVPEADLVEIERHIGQPLPKDYRNWLRSHNGGRMVGGGHRVPGVQMYLGGFAEAALREDGSSELVYWWKLAAAEYTTKDYLPLEYSASGYLLLKLTDPDRGSVWWLDGSDLGLDYEEEAEDAGFASEQEYICAEKLERVADSFDDLLGKLKPYREAVAD